MSMRSRSRPPVGRTVAAHGLTAVLFILTACESAERSADRTESQLEDRADQERENAINRAFD